MFIKREERKDKQASSSPANQFFEIDFIKKIVNSNSGYVPSTRLTTMREVTRNVKRQDLLADASRAFDSKDELILRANFLFEAVLLGDFYQLILGKHSVSVHKDFSRSNLINYLKSYHILSEKDLNELEKIINDVKNIKIEKILSTDTGVSAHYVLSIQCPDKKNSKFKINDISLLGQMITQIVTPRIYAPYYDEEDTDTPKFLGNILTKYEHSGFETIFNGHFSLKSGSVPFYKIYEENSDKENENLLSAYGYLEIAYYLLTQENVREKEYNEAKHFFAKAVFSFNKFYFSRGNMSTHLAYVVSPMLATMNLLADKEKNMDTAECIKILESASIFRDVFLDKMKDIYKDKFEQVSFEFLSESAKLDRLCQDVVEQIKSAQSIPLAKLFFNAKNIPLGIKCNLLDGLRLTNEEKKTILQNLVMQADASWYQADIKEKYLMISIIYYPLIELMDTNELESLLQSTSASIEIKAMICRHLIHRTNMGDVKAVDHLINLINDFRCTLKEMQLDEHSLKDKDELYEILFKLLGLQMNFSTTFDEPVLTDEHLNKLIEQWRQFPNEKKQEKVPEKPIEKAGQKPGLFSQSEYQKMQLRQVQKEKAIKYYLEAVPPVLHQFSGEVYQAQGLLAKLKESLSHVIDKEEFHSSYFPNKEDRDQLESPLITNVNSSLVMMKELAGKFKKINDTIAELKVKSHPQAAEQYDPLRENVQQRISAEKASTTYNLDVQIIRVEKLLAEANNKFSQLSTQLIVKNSSLKDIYNDFLKPAEKAYVEMENLAEKYIELARGLDVIMEDSIKRENNQEYYPTQSPL